jgi:hypothetical protein
MNSLKENAMPLRKCDNALQILSLSCSYVTNILSQAPPVKNSMQTVLQPHTFPRLHVCGRRATSEVDYLSLFWDDFQIDSSLQASMLTSLHWKT